MALERAIATSAWAWRLNAASRPAGVQHPLARLLGGGMLRRDQRRRLERIKGGVGVRAGLAAAGRSSATWLPTKRARVTRSFSTSASLLVT
jgi:hypothetical protein